MGYSSVDLACVTLDLLAWIVLVIKRMLRDLKNISRIVLIRQQKKYAQTEALANAEDAYASKIFLYSSAE